MNRSLRIILEAVPWCLLAFIVLASLVAPVFFETHVMSKDSFEGSGLVEQLTVAFLVVAIIFGLFLLTQYWKAFRYAHLRVGVIIWILGCIYFAGEEISWGQWLFQWDTPELVDKLNRQGETNLHNMSSWLNEKPRTLVEIWMIFASLIVTMLRRSGKMHLKRSDWREWINPTGLGISTCIVFLIFKGIGLFDSPQLEQLGNSEIREMLIAYFLALFIISVHGKLKAEVIAVQLERMVTETCYETAHAKSGSMAR